MKAMLFLILAIPLTSQAQKLPVPKTLGPAKTPVYFVSKNTRVVKKTPDASFIETRVILRWGVHVYESGILTYKCKKSRCELVSYTYVASYESCKRQKDNVQCSKKISSASPGGDSSSDDGRRSDRSLKGDDWIKEDHHRDTEEWPIRDHEDNDPLL